ncbi:MAG: alpha/beta hydrolase [Tateyamaria sp.]|uniref:alpha/beta fold hydrolase n=1 Tax=Tateyamaria sp. TaxID=1929288 RepID=UPI00328B10CB
MMRVSEKDLNGHTFTVREWGVEGLPKMLLLHGFPEYGGAWNDLALLLSDRFHCIAPDQRGYGASYAPQEVEAYAMEALVGDMATLIGSEAVIVVGHDWGSAVAYGLAMFRPDLVSHLVVANGVHPIVFQRAIAAGGAQSEASQYINKLRNPKSDAVLEADDFSRLMDMFSSHMDTSWLTGDVLEAQKAAWRKSGLRGMINWYRASPLAVADPGVPIDLPDMPLERFMVYCPHLLIWGEGDTALLPEANAGLEEFVPDLTRVSIPDGDHWVLHQHPNRVAGIIRDWLG